MANSHLPNSHPDVTPDWKEFPFSRTSFIDSIQTFVVEGYNGTRYAGAVPQDWCAYGGHILAAHGGYCAAVLLTTAHRYYRDKYSNKGSLDPVHIHVEFFHPMPQGLFHVVIKQLHSGKMSMTIQAELVSPDTDRTTYSVAIVRLGRLLETDGNNSIQPASDPLPNRERHCGRWVNSMFYTFNPPSASVRSYCPNDGNSILWSPRFGGQHTRSHWSKLDDGGLFQSEHILLLVDLVGQLYITTCGSVADYVRNRFRLSHLTMRMMLWQLLPSI